MIYCFLSDEALYLFPDGDGEDSVTNRGVGYLSDKDINYFKTPASIFDKRATRLDVASLPGSRAIGDLRLHFDNDRVTGEIFGTLDPTTEIPDVKEKLFNIIEFLYQSQGLTASELDTAMTADAATFGSSMSDDGYYVPTTCDISSSITNVPIRLYDESDPSVDIRNWIRFNMVIDGHTQEFTVWLNESAFQTDYPYSTIMEVVWPCDPEKFLDMSAYSNVLQAVTESGAYMGNILASKLTDEDYSGCKIYQTVYDNDAFVTNYLMPFGILYLGPEPSTIAIKTYIREALLALPFGDEPTWKSLFPDLFTSSAFFLVPMWDNTEEIAGGFTLYRSVENHKKIRDVMNAIFTSMSSAHLDSYVEVLSTDASEMLIAAISHVDNESIFSIKAEHPTYIAVDATTAQFDHMEEKTKGFAEKLCNAIGVLLGGENLFGYPDNVIDGKTYLTFSNDYIDYHVLKPNQFPTSY